MEGEEDPPVEGAVDGEVPERRQLREAARNQRPGKVEVQDVKAPRRLLHEGEGSLGAQVPPEHAVRGAPERLLAVLPELGVVT